MKEASGELNMTLVTIIAVAAIAGIFTLLLPMIRNSINDKWNDSNKAIQIPNGGAGDNAVVEVGP